ncbi:XRE family transcriptional regulator [Cochlodiniinecator piscidefendens]|uniref:XRE family transcriptional regulator n=1 Tax=Cochlodiniinecator piscidefendens TaxID=2715756 RepID=UPI00140B931E|nr:XRE family transcriptional regulator [Cochlodiniinecator piscidefendens]
MDDSISSDSTGDQSDLSTVVGRAVKRQRQIADITVRKLADMSGISSAMVSRIENGQVSPSLTTLEALADALSLSVIAFFADSVRTADVNYVKAGQGIPATRTFADHQHEFRILSRHRKNPLEFEASSVTIGQHRDVAHPKYINRGYVFITITEGECTYQCGDKIYQMKLGDSLSFDAELLHGVNEVVSKSVTFTTIEAKIT